MSTAKGKTFVLSVAILPPALTATIYFIHKPSLTLPTSILLLPFIYIYYLFVTYITIPYFNNPFKHLPQPPGEQFIGAHWYTNFVKPRGSPYREWIDTIPNDGLIFFRGPLHGFPTLLLTSSEGLQEFLITNAYDYQKLAADRWLLERFIGHGLIVSEGNEHKLQRKSVTPAFSGKHINDLVPLFWSKAKEFTDVIANQLDHVPNDKGRTGVVEINQWASRVTLDIIGLACVGRDFSSMYNDNDEIAQQYEKILQKDPGEIVTFALMSTLLPPVVARWQPFNRRVREAADGADTLRRLCRRLIEIKRKDMQTESSKHIDILSVLMRSAQFTSDGLVDQLLTFLAAGHETTSGSLTWTLWLLATNPSVQKTLRAELAAITTITSTNLDNLPYLNAVISEQLRLYPNVPMTGRVSNKDTTLLGQFIPKGTVVLSSPWAINRSHKFWGPDSEEFKPERWLKPNPMVKGPMSVVTFIHGPRSCIGQAFSRAELKCLVAAMIMKFDVQMANPDEVVVPGGIIAIKPLNGMNLRLKEL